jgi:hypothetical protein
MAARAQSTSSGRRVPAWNNGDCSTLRTILLLPLLLSSLHLAAQTTAAQRPATAIELTVVDAEKGQPLPDVQVLVAGRPASSTDSSGFVRLGGLSASRVDLEIRLLGYQPLSLDVGVPAGDTLLLTIPLEPSPLILPEVRAEVEAGPRSRQLTEFYQRVRTGTGQYFTRAEIERRGPRDLSDLMRLVPGMRLLTTPAGDKISTESKATAIGDLLDPESRECAIEYFLDGSPIKPIHGGVIGAEVALDEIEGIEIYRRGTTVPAAFHRMKNNCGVILIWKREGQ